MMRPGQAIWFWCILLAPLAILQIAGQDLPGIYIGKGATLEVKGKVEVVEDEGQPALRFATNGSFFLIQTERFQPEFTLSLWAKPAALDANQYLASQRLDNEDAQFRILGGETNPPNHGFFGVPGNGGDFHFPNDQWSHVVLRRDAEGHILLVNGQKVLGGPSAISYSIDPAPFSIGADTAGEKRWAGLVRDIAFLNQAVGDEELALIAASGNAVPMFQQQTLISLLKKCALIVLFAGFLCAMLWWCARRFKPVLQAYKVTVLVAASGVAATATAVLLLMGYVQKHDRQRFESEILTRRTIIDGTITIYTQIIERLAAMIAGHPNLSLDRWEHLVQQTDAAIHFPGIAEIRFLKKVHAWEWSDYWHEQGRNVQLDAPPQRGWLHLPLHFHSYIVHPEAEPRSSPELGRDHALDVDTRRMAEQVMKEGNTYASRLTFEQIDGSSEHPRFRIYMPVHNPAYKAGKTVEMAENFLDRDILEATHAEIERAARYLGCLYFTVDLNRMIETMYGFQRSDVGFEIYSDTKGTLARDNLYFTSHPEELDPLPYFEAVLPLRVYYKRWYLRFYTLPRFEQRSLRHWPWYAGAAGAVCTVLVTLLVGLQTRARLNEEEISEELRQSRDQLKAHFQEREKISRDLHDGAIQSVFGLGLGLQRAAAMLPDKPEVVRERLHTAVHDLQEIIHELRAALTTLKPKPASAMTLEGILNRYVQLLKNSTQVQPRVHIEGELPEIDHETSIQVLNIIREAVSNSLKHSEATEISISARSQGSSLVISVEDNGKGFDQTNDHGTGHGLGNMQARAQELGGRLLIESDSAGTSVHLFFSLDRCKPDPSKPLQEGVQAQATAVEEQVRRL